MRVRILAAIIGGTGAWMLLSYWPAYPVLLPSLREGAAVAGLLPMMWVAFGLLIPPFKILSAIALALRLRGGCRLACVILAADVLVVAVTGARLRTAVTPSGGVPWEVPGTTVVRVVEMWPSYLVAAISLVTLILLARGTGRPARASVPDPT